MNELRIISMLKEFPVGETAKSRKELLSKAEIVSYLSRFQEQFSSIDEEEREISVKQFLENVIVLRNNEIIPDIITAQKILNLNPDFLNDYGKIQYIKENNPNFDKTYDLIASTMELTETYSRSL